MLPTISKPEPLTPISLGYENAFGGSEAEPNPKEKYPTCLSNYAGKGYLADAKRCTGVELPQLEMAPFINSPADRPQPAGFGPVPVFWQPRRAEQGTPVLEEDKRSACLYGPDAQASMHNSAPLDQRFPNAWQGGETLTLTNILAGMQYGKTCSITLPRITPQLILDDKLLNTVCDTFWIDAKKNQLFMIYRAAYPMRMAQADDDEADENSISVRDAAAENAEQSEAA